jgi:hypothetical protein
MSPVKVPAPALVHAWSHGATATPTLKLCQANKADRVMAQEDWPETDVGAGLPREAPRARDLRRCKALGEHLAASRDRMQNPIAGQVASAHRRSTTINAPLQP